MCRLTRPAAGTRLPGAPGTRLTGSKYLWLVRLAYPATTRVYPICPNCLVYQRSRANLALATVAPEPRPVEPRAMGEMVELPEVGRLHHRYERAAA